MSCTAVVERLTSSTGRVTIAPPTGVTILAPFVLPTGINCQVNATLTIGVFSIDYINDVAYLWFADDAFTVQDLDGNIFNIGVINATQENPLQVPLYNQDNCIINTPITAEEYTQITRICALKTGPYPGPDVRIVARRRWGDDFAGCNVCNH